MKRILTIILIGGLIIGLTGCGNKTKLNKNHDTENIIQNNDNNDNNTNIEIDDNNLTCSGRFSLIMDVFVGKSSTVDGDESIHFSLAPSNEVNKYIENGNYKFIYDNNNLVSIEGIEVYKESFSKELTNEQIEEQNKEGKMKITKDNKGKITIKYKLVKDDDLVKAFKKESNLRKRLEEDAGLTCDVK